MASNDEQALTGEFLGRAAGEGSKLTMMRMRTARLLAFASLRLQDAFSAVSPDKKDLEAINKLLATRTQHEMRLHGVCDVVVKAQIQRMRAHGRMVYKAAHWSSQCAAVSGHFEWLPVSRAHWFSQCARFWHLVCEPAGRHKLKNCVC